MMQGRIPQLRLTSVKVLARKLRTTPAALARLCENVESCDAHGKPIFYYHKEKIDKKGKKRPTDTPIREFRVINDRINRLLQQIELPDYVKGGVRGESPVTNARCHTGKPLVVRIDIKSFFPNISQHRVFLMFLKDQGCSEPVASILTRLTTLHDAVPQGFPTSTSVATLVSLPLTRRLHGLATACGVSFTQYVDDFIFSGPTSFGKRVRKLIEIIGEERFEVNPKKVDLMPRNREQVATGNRVNSKALDVPKKQIIGIRKALQDLSTDVAQGRLPTEKELRSLHGRIDWIARFNHGAGKCYRRRVAGILNG
jgi:RNA-directed DNA polymerase